MKASELRIGNLVKRNSIVATCDFMSAANCYSLPEQYEPIPLTEEWLKRLGFERSEFNPKYYYLNGRLIMPTNGHWIDYANNVELKHVHSLQNLYFALTGDELKTTQL